ncbi:MAG: hypothetical protein ACRDHX_09945 [Chloroflexota bacterium]
MYLRITAQGARAEDLGGLLGKLPARFVVHQPPSARLRLIVEASQPGSITFTLLAYPEPASQWPDEPEKLEILDYVRTRVEALSPLFRSFLDSAFGAALRPLSREELLRTRFDLQAEIAPLAVNFRNPRLRGYFEPLGYRVEVESPIFGLDAVLLRVAGVQTVPDVLRHMFVLVPAVDRAKRPPLTRAEAGRLSEVCHPWLEKHPKREAIAHSYRLRLTTLLNRELLAAP